MTTISPTPGKVLVQVVPAETHWGALIIPDQAKDLPDKATVIAVGEPPKDKHGNLVGYQIAVGDTVLLQSAWAGAEVKEDDETYVVVEYSEIWAVLA